MNHNAKISIVKLYNKVPGTEEIGYQKASTWKKD